MTSVSTSGVRTGGPRGSGSDLDRLLSADEVAELIGMTRSYVYDLSRRGQIPTITFGRQRRYRRQAVLRWLDEIEGRTVR